MTGRNTDADPGNDIEVANTSLVCEGGSSAMNSALDRSTSACAVYAVAAGNNAKDASTFSPANHPRVIAVSAIADFNGRAGGSAPSTRRETRTTRSPTSATSARSSRWPPWVATSGTW